MNWEEIGFEEACELLEEVVRLLESGETTLEESLALFEQGIKLVRFCNECLDKAEGRIRVLVDEGFGPELRDLAQGGVG
ncbi:MAG: exodeoxyribonuclease VII small subunit [Firmicutes bacterium]|nr:exodeoxyribonuclease VII small subunit [Bacillota bacterium]